ncbi:MAG: hypothetical protein ABFD98_05445 [Syntrophobacteraceae bacterium]
MPVTEEASVTARNLSKVVFFRVAQYPFLALYVMFVPRYLGPEVYGKYAFLISIALICASLLSIGGNAEVFGRFVPQFQINREPNKIKDLSSSFLAMKLVLDFIVLSAASVIFVQAYGDRYPIDYFILIGLLALLIDLQSVPLSLLFGLNELGKFSFPAPAKKALALVLIPVLFHFYDLKGTILAILIVEFSIVVFVYVYTRGYFSRSNLTLNFSFLKPLLLYDMIFYLSGCLLGIWLKLGNTMIEYLLHDSQQVALFDIANQLLALTSNFSLVVLGATIPILSVLLLNGKEQKIMVWSSVIMKYMWIAIAMAAIAFFGIGREAMIVCIGSKYENAFPNAAIQLLCIFPVSIVHLCYVYSMVYSKPYVYLVSIGSSLAALFVFSFILIPMHGSFGCSVATLISCIVMAFVSGLYFRRQLIECLGAALKVAFLGLAFIPVVFFAGGLFMKIALTCLCALTYILLLFGANALSVREISELVQALRNRSPNCASFT